MKSYQNIEKQFREIAKQELSSFSDDVDFQGRFPKESIDALKAISALSLGNSESVGGRGFNVLQQAELCNILAKECASSAMVLGMHYIKCNSINRWASQQDFFSDYLVALSEQQRLIASMTSEEGIGGDLRQSQAAVQLNDDNLYIEKQSPCLSYVEEADDILLSCRAHEDAAPSDQRLLLLKKEQMQKTITRRWDAMGMRGTCSHACVVKGDACKDQLVGTPFADIANQGMIPDAHIIWANIWMGISQSAFTKAKKVSRKQFLKQEGALPGSARILNKMNDDLISLQSQAFSLAKRYIAAQENNDNKYLRSTDFAVAVNSLKVNASQISKQVCLDALEVCGIAGYKNDDDLSVARHIRDVLSATVMVSNERLVSVNAARLML